ncbi:unnamed protein product [Sphagnum jensenii]
MHTRGEERDMERKEHSVEAKLTHPNDGKRGIVLVHKGGKCSKSKGRRNSMSRVGSNNRAEWKQEEKRWKIKTYKSTALEWGGMGTSGAMCSISISSRGIAIA